MMYTSYVSTHPATMLQLDVRRGALGFDFIETECVADSDSGRNSCLNG